MLLSAVNPWLRTELSWFVKGNEEPNSEVVCGYVTQSFLPLPSKTCHKLPKWCRLLRHRQPPATASITSPLITRHKLPASLKKIMYRDFSGDPVVRTLLLLQGAQNEITYKFVAFYPQEKRRNHGESLLAW